MLLGRALQGPVSESIRLMYDHYVRHGEPVLAVEQLVDDLEEEDIRIPRALADLIVAAARDRGITRFTEDDVYALVDDEEGQAST